jgi:hypothetical protein
MRRWLHDNNLEPGSGLPLEDISEAQGMQRVLSAFITALSVSGVGISKETTTLLLADVDNELSAGVVSTNALPRASSSSSSGSGSGSSSSSFPTSLETSTDAGKGSSSSVGKKRKKVSLAAVADTDGSGHPTGMDDAASTVDAANPSTSTSKVPKKRQKVDGTNATEGASAGAGVPKAKAGRPRKQADDGSGIAEADGGESCSQRRLPLPSHLRPPAIVTSAGTRDQDEVVEILSSMKNSPHSTQPSPRSFSGSASYFDAVLASGSSKRKAKAKATVKIKTSDMDVCGSSSSSSSAAESPTDRALKAVRHELARRGCYPTSRRSASPAELATAPPDATHAIATAGAIGEGGRGSGGGCEGRDGQRQQQEQQPPGGTSADGSASEHDVSVPFQLLPFFKLLGAGAQSGLMLQLIEHFQQTVHAKAETAADDADGQHTVRGASGSSSSSNGRSDSSNNSGGHQAGSLSLPFSFSKSMSMDGAAEGGACVARLAASAHPQYSYSLVGNELTLLSPRGAVTIRQQQADHHSSGLDPSLNAAFDAAVNVAVKCATREASFEEVLSWLTQATGLASDAKGHQQHEEYGTIVLDAAPSQAQTQAQTQAQALAPSASKEQVVTNAAQNRGVSLPSHLRPPAILTTANVTTIAGVSLTGYDGAHKSPSATRPLSASSCRSALADQQHDELVEILSAFKSNHNSPSNFLHGQTAVLEAEEAGAPCIPQQTLGVAAAATVAERALQKVQQELARQRTAVSRRAALREGGGAAEAATVAGQPRGVDFAATVDSAVAVAIEDSAVPFQLLPFFGQLSEFAQRSLMRQLVDHFQQTNFTPRNAGALLATPRFNDMQILENLGDNEYMWGAGILNGSSSSNGGDVFTYSISGNFLTLGSPRSAGSDPLPLSVVDPHCFEEGFIAAEGFDDAATTGKNGKQKKNSRKKGGGEPQRDTVQSFLDAPVNAAVNIAIKCATREASFEEVLSWLLAASASASSSASSDAASGINEYSANSLLLCAFPR